MRHRLGGMAGALCAVAVTALFAQQSVSIERIVLLVNDDFITLIDVRKARLLKLVDLSSPSDADVAMRLAERQLELAEVTRAVPKDPAPQDVEEHRRTWMASLGAAADIPALLRATGMTADELATWLRNDVRIAMYVDQAFGARAAPTRAEMLKYYQDHVSDYTRAGVVRPFDDVSSEVKQTLQDSKRAELVKAWAASLVRQADVRPPR